MGMSGTNTRSRGRPRLFDEDAVLDEFTELFWRKGYSQTSMTDLVDASGVHKSSLYSTFGTKEELFAKILRRYFAGRMDAMSALVDRAGPGVDGIHAFLSSYEATSSRTEANMAVSWSTPHPSLAGPRPASKTSVSSFAKHCANDYERSSVKPSPREPPASALPTNEPISS